jgi:phosphate transport system substrate-binding protein
LTVGTRSTEESVQAFCQGQVQLIVVSRPLSAAEEGLCRKNSVEAVKFPLGYAAVAAIASPDARWLTCLTPAQLKQLDQALAKQQPFSWQQIDANYPALDVQIISSPTPTTTQLLQAKGYTALAAARPKVAFQTAEQTLLQSVGPVGFVGLHQATQLGSKALFVPIRHASSDTCVLPSEDAVLAAHYTELTRPLLAYISAKALESNAAAPSFLHGLLQVVQHQAAQREPTDKAAESTSASSPSTGRIGLQLPRQDPALATFVPISATQAEDLLNELK